MYKSVSIPISETSQVGEARRMAHRMATELGMDAALVSNVGIIATELGSNLHKHARGGELLMRKLAAGEHGGPGHGRKGIEIISLDRGPGIRELARCLEDGYSSTGTTGNGLGSVRRLSTKFDVYTSQQGTALVSQTWVDALPRHQQSAGLEVGAVCIPFPREPVCGDGWSATSGAAAPGDPVQHQFMVADGLGHGVHAAEASDQAVLTFDENTGRPLQVTLQLIHNALRHTRGAAALLLEFSARDRKIICSGVGNVSAVLVQGAAMRQFVSMNGTLGHQVSKMQQFDYEWPAGSIVVMFSDGLQSRWKLDGYPGLQTRHPSLVAAILYRDFRRERDDVTVLVVRETPPYTIAT